MEERAGFASERQRAGAHDGKEREQRGEEVAEHGEEAQRDQHVVVAAHGARADASLAAELSAPALGVALRVARKPPKFAVGVT